MLKDHLVQPHQFHKWENQGRSRAVKWFTKVTQGNQGYTTDLKQILETKTPKHLPSPFSSVNRVKTHTAAALSSAGFSRTHVVPLLDETHWSFNLIKRLLRN